MRFGWLAAYPGKDARFAGEVGDVLCFIVVARFRIAVVLDVLDDLDLARRQMDFLALLLVVDCPSAWLLAHPAHTVHSCRGF